MSETDTPAAEKRTNARSSIDLAAKTLTISLNGASNTYDLKKLPENAATWAMGRGVMLRLQRTETPVSAFDDLCAGNIPAERAAGEKPLSLSDQAIALMLRDGLAKREGVTKKDRAAHEALLERAIATVRGMPKEKKAVEHKTREVIGYIASLRQAQAPQSSLLDGE